MIENYEAVFIFDPSLKEEEMEKRVQDACSSITSKKGEIVNQERMGKRRLAYPIKKKVEGIYHVIIFKAPNEIISAIRSEYGLMSSLIRFMIIRT